MDRIDSKTARGKLKPRREPYWFRLGPGRHLGYRRIADGGTWLAKYRDTATGDRPQKPLGAIEPAGKKDAFHVALALATAWFEQTAAGIEPKGTDVATVCRDYVAELRGKGRTAAADDAEGRFRRLVYGKPLGAIDRDQLRRTHLVQWFAAQLPSDKTHPEPLRKAKDSANRNRTALIAALNLAVVNGKFASDFAWRAFKPHGNVGARRDRLLDRTQRKRLLQAATADLKAFCEASLLLACRPGELANANVADFDRKAGSLVLSGKTGRRVVELSSAALAVLSQCSKGRIGAAPLLARANGERWDRFSWRDGIRDAVKASKLPADVRVHVAAHIDQRTSIGRRGSIDREQTKRHVAHDDSKALWPPGSQWSTRQAGHCTARLMATHPQTLAWWRALIAEARNGNEQPFLFAFTFRIRETSTRELDADGKHIVEYTWHEVPGEVRQEIVDLLVDHPFLKRGRQPAVDPGTAAVIRAIHDMQTSEHNPERKTKKKSEEEWAKRLNTTQGTMRDLIGQRKTYAPKKNLKEPKRVRRKT